MHFTAHDTQIIAKAFLGQPNPKLTKGNELRFGKHGSVSVDLVKSEWYDHEHADGGDMIKLIKLNNGGSYLSAIKWLRNQGIKDIDGKIDGDGAKRGNGHARGNGGDDADDIPHDPTKDPFAGRDVVFKKTANNGNGASVEQTPNAPFRVTQIWTYTDEAGEPLFDVCRKENGEVDDGGKPLKTFRQRRPDPSAPGGYVWNVEGVKPVPYELPRLLDAIKDGRPILITEGEKAADAIIALGGVATTNAGGAKKFQDEHAVFFKDASVAVLSDNDKVGREHAKLVASKLAGVAKRVRIVTLPGLPEKGDVVEWIGAGGTLEQLEALVESAAVVPPGTPEEQESQPRHETGGVTLDDFHAYMPMSRQFIFTPSRELWPASSVDARVPPVPLVDKNGKPVVDKDGNEKYMRASAWLSTHQAVEQMTWAPGEPMLIEGRLIHEGGWIKHKGVTVFNLYRAPTLEPGDPDQAKTWIDHAYYVFGDDAHHIIRWLAHRVQRPHEKINHAIVLGGEQGIGKDSLIEPAKRAIGPWNFSEVSPGELLGRFCGFRKSVILRVNEAHDLGDVDRFAFYDHTKSLIAAPPDVLRVDEKHLREYYIPNVCGVILTTNHKTSGIFLPSDDRRHFVAWSDLTKEDFPPEYWNDLWRWYDSGGDRHVAAYLATLDISGFDPKAPPPKTPAFWTIVDAGRAPEDAELADLLDEIGNPDAITLAGLMLKASDEIRDWLADRKNRRLIPHRLEKCGYSPVRNDYAKDGFWKLNGKRQVIYAKQELSEGGRVAAAAMMAKS